MNKKKTEPEKEKQESANLAEEAVATTTATESADSAQESEGDPIMTRDGVKLEADVEYTLRCAFNCQVPGLGVIRRGEYIKLTGRDIAPMKARINRCFVVADYTKGVTIRQVKARYEDMTHEELVKKAAGLNVFLSDRTPDDILIREIRMREEDQTNRKGV